MGASTVEKQLHMAAYGLQDPHSKLCVLKGEGEIGLSGAPWRPFGNNHVVGPKL